MAAMAAPYVLGAITIALAAGLAVDAIIGEWANQLDTYKDYIKDIASSDKDGVIISWDCAGKLYCRATIVGRSAGNGYTMGMSKLAASFVVDWGQMDGHGNSLWEAGRACTMTASNPSAGNYYSGDNRLCR